MSSYISGFSDLIEQYEKYQKTSSKNLKFLDFPRLFPC